MIVQYLSLLLSSLQIHEHFLQIIFIYYLHEFLVTRRPLFFWNYFNSIPPCFRSTPLRINIFLLYCDILSNYSSFHINKWFCIQFVYLLVVSERVMERFEDTFGLSFNLSVISDIFSSSSSPIIFNCIAPSRNSLSIFDHFCFGRFSSWVTLSLTIFILSSLQKSYFCLKITLKLTSQISLCDFLNLVGGPLWFLFELVSICSSSDLVNHYSFSSYFYWSYLEFFTLNASYSCSTYSSCLQWRWIYSTIQWGV